MASLRKLSLLAAALWLQFGFSSWMETSRGAESGQQFPYSAFVAMTEAPIRSGPGETYYPVLNLKLGDAVEVWRQDPGGWLAVRPPEGAFSWVSADFVQQTGEKTGRVIGNEVNARVGTKFSDLRDAIQVQLSAGDEVDILESRTLRTGEQETLWYKILPPAGEFRWVAARHVVLHPSQLPPPAMPNIATDRSGSSANQAEVQQASFNGPAASAAAAVSNGDLLADLRSMPADASIDAQLDEMETVLSRMVTAEPTAWSFAELKQRGETLLERSETALERSRARTYLAKVARFEDIQKRYASIAQVREQTATVDRELVKSQQSMVAQTSGSADLATGSPAAAPASESVARSTGEVTRYDGVGRLMVVVNAKPGAPGYAIATSSGEIAAYVVAAPGMNLKQYVGLDVGVNGIRGYVTDQRIEQITAKRIDVIGSRQAESGSRIRRR